MKYYDFTIHYHPKKKSQRSDQYTKSEVGRIISRINNSITKFI